MELVVFLTLTLDVPTDHRFVPMFANCTGEISVRPEFPAPQLLLYLRTPTQYLTRRQAFHQRHDLRHAVRWHRLHKKMNVILVCANLQKLYLIAVRYLQAYFLQYLVNMIVDHRPSILGRKYQVVQQYRHVVALVDVFAHPFKATPQAAGNLTRKGLKNDVLCERAAVELPLYVGWVKIDSVVCPPVSYAAHMVGHGVPVIRRLDQGYQGRCRQAECDL